MTEYIVAIIEIFIGAFLAEAFFDWLQKRRARKLDIGCSYCKKALPLARTPDKLYYMCKTCFVAYVAEHFPNLDPNLRKIFRRRKVHK